MDITNTCFILTYIHEPWVVISTLHTHPHVWLWVVGSKRGNEITDTSFGSKVSPQDHFSWQGEWASHTVYPQSRPAASLNQEMATSMVPASSQKDSPWWLPLNLFEVQPIGKRPRGKVRLHCRNCVLAGSEMLGDPQEKMGYDTWMAKEKLACFG